MHVVWCFGCLCSFDAGGGIREGGNGCVDLSTDGDLVLADLCFG